MPTLREWVLYCKIPVSEYHSSQNSYSDQLVITGNGAACLRCPIIRLLPNASMSLKQSFSNGTHHYYCCLRLYIRD